MSVKPQPLRERLYQHISPEPNSGCWLWAGPGTHPQGYGYLEIPKSLSPTARRKMMGAHVLSYIVHKGPVPSGRMICHTCDMPPCVNPDHLYAGTAKQNGEDMRRRGRSLAGDRNPSKRPEVAVQRRGEDNGNVRITEETVVAILVSPLNQRMAAARYHVAASWVQRIRRREVWKHVWVDPRLIPPRKFFNKKNRRNSYANSPPSPPLGGGEGVAHPEGTPDSGPAPSPKLMQESESNVSTTDGEENGGTGKV
jgi:hypothetical protein